VPALHATAWNGAGTGPPRSVFFSLYGIPILRGRSFRRGDGGNQAIVGERLAARLWSRLDPVGRSFRVARARARTRPTLGSCAFAALTPGQ
jgi:hypothetical protein